MNTSPHPELERVELFILKDKNGYGIGLAQLTSLLMYLKIHQLLDYFYSFYVKGTVS